MMNARGMMSPCQTPAQNPAGCAPVCAYFEFGPATVSTFATKPPLLVTNRCPGCFNHLAIAAKPICPGGENPANESAGVGLPADSSRSRHHTKHEPTPDQRNDRAQYDAAKAARVPAAQHQETEVAENDTAGSDVHGARSAQQPREER